MTERKTGQRRSISAKKDQSDDGNSLEDDNAVPIDEEIRILNDTAQCSGENVKFVSEVESCGLSPLYPDNGLESKGSPFDEVEGLEEDAEHDRGCLAGEMMMTTGEFRTRPKPIDESDRSLLVGDAEELIPGFLPESGVHIYESALEMRRSNRATG
jgi:hypothetical protein